MHFGQEYYSNDSVFLLHLTGGTPLIKMVSVNFLHCKVTLFLFVIKQAFFFLFFGREIL